MTIVNKQLSKECLEVISDLKKAAKGGKINITVVAHATGRGYVWGCEFTYYDDESKVVAEETFYTMKGSTRRVSGFTVLFDEKENAFDGEMQNFYLTDKSKTISEFIIALISEDLTPSVLVMIHAGLEESIACDIGSEGGEDDDEEDGEEEEEDDDIAYPCVECDGDEEECSECTCLECERAECTPKVRLMCVDNPFPESENKPARAGIRKPEAT
jgi:hypothetical protein